MLIIQISNPNDSSYICGGFRYDDPYLIDMLSEDMIMLIKIPLFPSFVQENVLFSGNICIMYKAIVMSVQVQEN